MKACILINAFLRGEEYLYQPRRIREELVKLGVEADVRTPGTVSYTHLTLPTTDRV